MWREESQLSENEKSECQLIDEFLYQYTLQLACNELRCSKCTEEIDKDFLWETIGSQQKIYAVVVRISFAVVVDGLLTHLCCASASFVKGNIVGIVSPQNIVLPVVSITVNTA